MTPRLMEMSLYVLDRFRIGSLQLVEVTFLVTAGVKSIRRRFFAFERRLLTKSFFERARVQNAGCNVGLQWFVGTKTVLVSG